MFLCDFPNETSNAQLEMQTNGLHYYRHMQVRAWLIFFYLALIYSPSTTQKMDRNRTARLIILERKIRLQIKGQVT